MTSKTANRTPSVIRSDIERADKVLANNGRISLRHQFDAEFDKTIQPLLDAHNASFEAAVATAKEERNALISELRQASGGSIPRGSNAASQNVISFDEAVVLSIAACSNDASFEGNIGPSSIVATFDSIGYSTTSQTPGVQVSNALAGLIESNLVKKVGRGSYALLKAGRAMAETTQSFIDNTDSSDD